MKINWFLLAPIFAIALLAVFGLRLANNSSDLSAGVDTTALPSTQEGRPAPPLVLDPLGDTPLLTHEALSSGQEALIVVNFFASWCPPCRAEHPTLTALAEAGVPLYGVNYRDRPAQALQFLDELGNPYALLGRNDTGAIGPDWGIVAMPETFFIDGDGNVVLHFRGPVVRRTLDAQIRPALAEAGYTLPDLPPLEG